MQKFGTSYRFAFCLSLFKLFIFSVVLQPADLSYDLSFKIIVIQDLHLNVFAFPNAVISIHSGILARIDNEAQLAALLAHEMAHCTSRHALRAMRGFRTPLAIVTAVNETLSLVKGLIC